MKRGHLRNSAARNLVWMYRFHRCFLADFVGVFRYTAAKTLWQTKQGNEGLAVSLIHGDASELRECYPMSWMRQLPTRANLCRITHRKPKSRSYGRDRDASKSWLNLLAIEFLSQPVWLVRRIPWLDFGGTSALFLSLSRARLGTVRRVLRAVTSKKKG